MLRRTYTFLRDLASARRRAGQRINSLEDRAKKAAKEHRNAIKRHKKAHRDDFLVDGSNIWQTAKSLKPDKRRQSRTDGGSASCLLPTATDMHRRRRSATAAQRSGHAEPYDEGVGPRGDVGQGLEGA
ncbi:uncharacterized protein FPRO_16132 [Fusarium proliferatum ET1]|uniref:Uncharacterized protein n=1 Tax=Fusarium proliferatum (strain ET1) TaxID=1227346 RepID=A0A1L7WBC7_FUSPR|nr:uncharacterized protein FPRO_16132 [Fusarium proliferatum ET1]CZR49927.1 uncharacterized protein FPRO_16132 [Fusarium proliferatum ET1]